jgi:hypothetical protein
MLKSMLRLLGALVRERRLPRKFLNYMVLMSSIIDSQSSSVQEEANNKFGGMPWCKMMCGTLCPGLEGQLIPGVSSRSTFLAKREC